jgi:hypothetical protein
MTASVLVGVGWYSEEQWTMLKLLADDPGSLDETYKKWEAGAQKALGELRKQPGIEAIKFPVDVEALRRWCRERGKPLDGASRAEYIAEGVQRMAKSGHQTQHNDDLA